MAGIPAFLLRHTVTVEPLAGEGPFGATFGPAGEVRCFRDDRRRLVRDITGSQVVSETTLFMRLDEACPAGSRVGGARGRGKSGSAYGKNSGGRKPRMCAHDPHCRGPTYSAG